MQRPPDEPEVNLEQILESLRNFFNRFRIGGGGGAVLYFLVALLVVGAIIWVSTGFYTVSTVGGEVAVLRLFGKYNGEAGPGLHWFWPNPVGKRSIVQADERRRLELGFRGNTPAPAESLMITGDENIVDAQLLVQYNVKDPRDFLFNVVDPEGVTLRDIAETALRQVVGSRPIDDILTDQKEAVQADTKTEMQRLLDKYGTGILITEVKLQNVNPPGQVQAAFDDVVKAKEDKERIINLADAYKESVLPQAEGAAARLREDAEAFRVERINLATGQAQRFTAILTEYRTAKTVTRQRLILETMEEVYPGIVKLLLDPEINTIVVSPGTGGTVLPVPESGAGPR